MKYTLLELVQAILASIDGDEVTTYNATAESEAIAGIIKECYFNISGMLDLPEHYEFFSLEQTSTSSPPLMTLPTSVLTLGYVKYNYRLSTDTIDSYTLLEYMEIADFLRMQEMLSGTGISTFSYTGASSSVIPIKFRTDKMPSFYTTWDDYHILFDSHLLTEETFLHKTRTQCYGLIAPTFTLNDSFTPDLDGKQFQLLLQESKATASIQLRQQANPRAEKKAKDNWINTQRTKQGIPNPYSEYHKLPNYGRRCR